MEILLGDLLLRATEQFLLFFKALFMTLSDKLVASLSFFINLFLSYIILFFQQINDYTSRTAQALHLLLNNRIGIMNFCSSLDINIIHIRLLKCLLQISRLRVLKKWKLNTNINKENACIQALISKVNLLRSVDHGHFIDTQETQRL